WLLRDGSMRVRTTHPGFTQAVNAYFDKLVPKMVPLQFKKGGPIIAVQVENEYESFAKDQGYMLFIKEALQSRGINELLLTSHNTNTLKSGSVDGVIQSVKLQKLNQRNIQELNAVQPNSPSMVMEYWTGWYDAWGDLHHVLPPEDMVSTVRKILRRGMSVNLYMFHGGSSFGFMTGAVSDPSYRALVSSYGGEAYEPAIMYQHLSLWDALSFAEGPFKSSKPINMENLPANNANGQSYGYTLYETTINSGGLLQSGDNVRDRALTEDILAFSSIRTSSWLFLMEKRTLSFLVENCGRVHRGRDLDKQHKGLVGDILLNQIPLRDFTIYSLDMKPSFIDSLFQAPWKSLPENPSFPGFFLGRLFAYSYPSDTFVKLPGWDKGVVFINGLNLGRYWSIGPQQALYLPGPFLNSGINQVIIFEEQEGDYKVHFEDSPDLGMAAEIQ
ncbi:hypothetical protein XENORESO_003775, partial [Xenotaenia resolanae]